MKTVGLDAVLNALKGDSAPITKDKTPAGEGNAFNAAFDAAARSAGETAPVNGNASASLAADKSPQGGNALPENGKELPSSGDDNLAVEAGSGGLAVDSLPTGELAPSPFMKAALDKAAGGNAMGTPMSSSPLLPATSQRTAGEMPGLTGQSADTAVRAGLPSHIPPAASTSSITASDADSTLASGPNTSTNTLPQTREPKVAPRLNGQGFMAPSKGAVAVSGFIEGPEFQVGKVANASGTLKDQNSLTTPRSAPLAAGTVAATGLSATPMSPSDMASIQRSVATSTAMGAAQGTTPSAPTALDLSATPPLPSDIAGTQKPAVTSTAMGAAQGTTPSAPTALDLSATPPLPSDIAGTQKPAVTSTAMGAAQGTTPSAPTALGLSATSPLPSDIAGTPKPAVTSTAMGAAQGTTPSAPAASGLSATPPLPSDIAGTQKPAVTSTAMGAAQDINADQRTAPATDIQIANGPSNRPVGGAVSMAKGANLVTELGTTEVLGKGSSEITRALQGESFGAALNSSLVRAKDFREGSPVENQPRTRVADAASVAGLNPTPRSAESSTMSAATQVPAMKATPDAAGFPQEVLTRVRMIQGQGQTEARINLHPAELGRLQIAVTSEGDATRVAFVVDNAQAKEALEQAMPRLREFLQQAGLQLAEGSVSQQGQQNSAGFAHSETRSGDGHSANAHDAEEDVVINGKSDRGSDPSRMLDAYA